MSNNEHPRHWWPRSSRNLPRRGRSAAAATMCSSRTCPTTTTRSTRDATWASSTRWSACGPAAAGRRGTRRRRKFDYVYHLAAEFGRWNGEDYYENVWRTNAIGTKNILRMQEREGFAPSISRHPRSTAILTASWPEDVMDKVEIKQMNDYAMSKWVNEMQVLNSATQFDTESVRVRLFNTYGPGEHYSPYRSVICLFCYRLLHDIPITVYRGYKRTSTFITDMARTLANISDNFVPGEVYNIGGDGLPLDRRSGRHHAAASRQGGEARQLVVSRTRKC